MKHKLIIKGTLPSLNEYIASLNNNRFKGAKLKKEVEAVISLFIKSQLRGISIKDKSYISFKWFEPNKKRDKDNIAFAKKFIFDALVSCQVLKNDGWAYIEGFSDEFCVDKLNPRVEVVIREQEI